MFSGTSVDSFVRRAEALRSSGCESRPATIVPAASKPERSMEVTTWTEALRCKRAAVGRISERGRRDGRGCRGAGRGTVAGGTGARALRGQRPAARCAAGADSEEAAGGIPPLEHTVPVGPVGADTGDASACANLQSEPASMPIEPGATRWTRSSACIGRRTKGIGRLWTETYRITPGRSRTRKCCGPWRVA